MNYPKFIVSCQVEEPISKHRVKTKHSEDLTMYLVPETNLVNSFDPSSVANLAFFPVEFSKLMAETEILKKVKFEP